MNTETIVAIVFLAVFAAIVIFLLFFLNKICNFLEDKLNKISFLNFFWDQTIFARRYVLRLQSKYSNWTEELATKNVYLYTLATRPHFVPGITCFIYVLIKLMISGNPVSAFLTFTKNTVAGNALDYWHILLHTFVFHPWSYLLAGVINLISLFLIRRRYDTETDRDVLHNHRLLRLGSSFLTMLSFISIQFVLSELFDSLSGINVELPGSVPVWVYFILIVLLFPIILSALYYFLKALLSWVSEMVQALTACFLGLGITAILGYTIINKLGELPNEVNQLLAVSIIIVAYSIIKGVRYLLFLRNKKKNVEVEWDNTYFPRKIVAKNWQKYHTETGIKIPGYISLPN